MTTKYIQKPSERVAITDLIRVNDAAMQHRLFDDQIDIAIKAKEIPWYYTPYGKMIKKSDAALLKVRPSNLRPL